MSQPHCKNMGALDTAGTLGHLSAAWTLQGHCQEDSLSGHSLSKSSSDPKDDVQTKSPTSDLNV